MNTWILKINYWWCDNSYDEESDQYFDSAEDAYDTAKRMAVNEAEISSKEHECGISLRFYNKDMVSEIGCSGAYAVIDLSYLYDLNEKGQPSVCRYIVCKGKG